MTSWKNNASFDDWKESLHELLESARTAVAAGDDDAANTTIASLRALAETLPTASEANAAKLEKQINDVIAALAKLGAAVQTKA